MLHAPPPPPKPCSPTIEPHRTGTEEKPSIRPPLENQDPKQEPRPHIAELSNPRPLSLGRGIRF